MARPFMGNKESLANGIGRPAYRSTLYFPKYLELQHKTTRLYVYVSNRANRYKVTRASRMS